MARMRTIYCRYSYGTGTTLAGCFGKAYADTTKAGAWMLADRLAGLSLSDWAIIIGIACTVITCGVNWYYRRKERDDRLNGDVSSSAE